MSFFHGSLFDQIVANLAVVVGGMLGSSSLAMLDGHGRVGA